MLGVNPEAGGSPRLLRGIGAGLALAAVALLANAAHLATEPGATAIPVLGWFGPAKVSQLRMQRLDKQGRPPAGTERLARAALDGQPLAFEPFYAAALARFEPRQGGPDSVATLLREAIRRNPRSRESRVLLTRHAVARGDL